jgi:serine protease Do
MKKIALISLASFLFGLMLAGYIFVYLPEHKAPAKSFLEESAEPLGSALYAQSSAVKPTLDFAAISDKLGPTVVKVECEKVERQQSFGFDQGPGNDFWDRFFGSPSRRPAEQKVTVQGTGFFISADGYLITNNHIVENGQKIRVFTAGGDEFLAKIIGTDPRTDVALIKVETKNASFAELGDSAALKVGEWVLAIGNPLGMEHTVTAGIVSAKSRQLLDLDPGNSYQDYIQTDAAINRGNSGGPLVNMKGEVVGINSNILTGSMSGGNIGIGFAIPSNLAKKVVAQLKEKGKVIRGYLGINIPFQPIDEETRKSLSLPSRKGALISSVEAGTPAEKAGLKQYDVVIELNGEPIDSGTDLRMKIADFKPGTKIELKVIRDGKEKTISATVAELEDQNPATSAARRQNDIGFQVTALTPNLARRYGLTTTRGLLITDVDPSSDAGRKGLQPGDIIREVNRQAIETEEAWDALIAKRKSGDGLLLLVRREGDGGRSQDFIVTIRIP